MRCCVLILLASVPVTAADPVAYTLKLKSRPVDGKTITVSETSRDDGSTKTYDSSGKLVKETAVRENIRVVHHTMFRSESATDYRMLTRYETLIDSALKSPPSHAGRSVVTECKDGAARIGVVGKTVIDKQDFEQLLRKANSPNHLDLALADRLMLPKKPVAVGESWTVDAVAFSKLLEFGTVDPKSSTGAGKLLRAYRKGGSMWGAIEIRLSLALKSMGPVTFAKPMILELTQTIETAIDGSGTARIDDHRASMKGTGKTSQDGVDYRIEFDASYSGREITSEERDDPIAQSNPVVALSGPETWVAYTSKDGKYTARFPVKPEIAEKNDDKGVTATASATIENGNIYYSISVTTYSNPDPTADPQALLKRIADEFKDGTVESGEVTIDGHKGIRLVRNMEKEGVKMILHYRAFYIDGKLYQNIVVIAATLKDKADPQKFLDSFHFVKKKAEN